MAMLYSLLLLKRLVVNLKYVTTRGLNFESKIENIHKLVHLSKMKMTDT